MSQSAIKTKISPVVRPFQVTDVQQLVNRDAPGQDMTMTVQQATAGPAFTAWVGQRPIGCAGVVLAWPGVGMAWMAVSDDIAEHGLWLTRIVRAFLRDIIRANRLHRLEAVVLEENTRNKQWLAVLGFAYEGGTAHKYLPDKRAVQRFELVEGMDTWPM